MLLLAKRLVFFNKTSYILNIELDILNAFVHVKIASETAAYKNCLELWVISKMRKNYITP